MGCGKSDFIHPQIHTDILGYCPPKNISFGKIILRGGQSGISASEKYVHIRVIHTYAYIVQFAVHEDYDACLCMDYYSSLRFNIKGNS